ncbi:hypothetical protein [Streptomyces antibioticus]|uniref:hypothetical protein n=1 Tax=Streptomyces antibioticus TaxID=1890 RepID=UPI003D71EA07
MSLEPTGTAARSTRSGRRASARPVRDPDPARNAAYWARIERIVDEAPPLTDEQRAAIRLAFHQPTPPAREAA